MCSRSPESPACPKCKSIKQGFAFCGLLSVLTISIIGGAVLLNVKIHSLWNESKRESEKERERERERADRF